MSNDNVPPTSTPNLQRHRTANSVQNASSSPSTTMSESGVSTGFQIDDPAVRVQTSAGFLAARKITIRSDPALLTCFDAADKQLYDLWALRT